MSSQDRYDSLFQYYSGLIGYDWVLAKAQAKQESNFNPDAVSRCGAKGLAQFLDSTFAEWEDGTPGVQPPIKTYSPYNPEDCISAQIHYMKWLLNLCQGDVRYALAGYNWGPGRVQKYIQAGNKFEDVCQLMPPETQNYVSQIMYFYQLYNKQTQ